MVPSSIRVLVVDDYEPFRRFVRWTLANRPEFQVIGEASDGIEAVLKAEKLQPDLIVLDIGLPSLNGIESARRIRNFSPESKILFLSQETSADVVQEALGLGVLGYVVKAHAGLELLPAIEAVCQGRQYVGSGLSGPNITDAWQPLAHSSPCYKEALSSLAPANAEIARSHEVRFCSDDASFLVGFSCFVEAALEAGSAIIVVATESHRRGLVHRLEARGVNLACAIQKGRFIPLDAAETLSKFMVNDRPDPVRFFKIADDLVVSAARAAEGKHPRVVACGECAPILWSQGKADAAIQLEQLWDKMAKIYDVAILCGYVLKSPQRKPGSQIYERILAEHSAVFSLPAGY